MTKQRSTNGVAMTTRICSESQPPQGSLRCGCPGMSDRKAGHGAANRDYARTRRGLSVTTQTPALFS